MNHQEPIGVGIRRLPHAEDLPLPARATPASAGYDLHAAIDLPYILRPGARALIPTGLVLEMPVGLEAQIRPRSGLALKHGITVLNAPGTIDADYRGEVGVILVNFGDADVTISRGDRIAQMVFARVQPVAWAEGAISSETDRGTGGFGSTGHGI